MIYVDVSCVIYSFLANANSRSVHVRYMLWRVRLSVVCLSSIVCNVRFSRLKFSAIVLRRLVPWPSVDIHGKFYVDRPREPLRRGI